MRNQDSQPITIGGAKTAWYFGTSLVFIVLGFGGMLTQGALTSQKVDSLAESFKEKSKSDDEMFKDFLAHDREQDNIIARHDEVIRNAQTRGLLGKSSVKTDFLGLALAPTPTAGSAKLEPQPQTVVNNYIQPTPTRAKEPVPTPKPTPTPLIDLGGILGI